MARWQKNFEKNIKSPDYHESINSLYRYTDTQNPQFAINVYPNAQSALASSYIYLSNPGQELYGALKKKFSMRFSNADGLTLTFNKESANKTAIELLEALDIIHSYYPLDEIRDDIIFRFLWEKTEDLITTTYNVAFFNIVFTNIKIALEQKQNNEPILVKKLYGILSILNANPTQIAHETRDKIINHILSLPDEPQYEWANIVCLHVYLSAIELETQKQVHKTENIHSNLKQIELLEMALKFAMRCGPYEPARETIFHELCGHSSVPLDENKMPEGNADELIALAKKARINANKQFLFFPLVLVKEEPTGENGIITKVSGPM